jgi:parallel beta-helix repeat protein
MSLGINTRITNTKEQPSPFSRGKTLYVGGIGPDNYTKIQDAINDSVDGDTVFVFDDSSPYYENVVVNKSINLIGEDRNTTIIDGNYKGSVITINSDNVVVRGFTLKNIKDFYLSEGKYGCIKIKGAKNVFVTDNIITPGDLKNEDFGSGVYIYGSGTDDNVIKNNIIFFYDKDIGCSRGVSIVYGADCNTVYNNEIYGCHEAVSIRPFGSECDDNIIDSNYFHKLNIGVGISEPAPGTRIISNKITYCAMWGVFLFFADNNLIDGNIIEQCTRGIDLSGDGCCNNFVINNNVSYNDIGIEVNGRYNTIYHNNFINNLRNAKAENYNYNTWDYGISGNYWDDYKNKYLDAKPRLLKTWIWDTPYEITGRSNKDRFPLVNEWPKSLSKTLTSSLFLRFLEQFPILQKMLLLQR